MLLQKQRTAGILRVGKVFNQKRLLWQGQDFSD